jgi:hypothetical protein
MTERPDQQGSESQGPAGREVVLDAGSLPENGAPHAAYVNLVHRIRKAVVIAMAVFGVGFVICTRREHYLTYILGEREAGIWTWGRWAFGIGVLACLVSPVAFIVEELARPAKPKPVALRPLFARSLLIMIAVLAVCLSTALACGPWQAFGAVIGTILSFAAVREHHMVRAILAVLAAIVLGLTLLGIM